MPWVVRGTSSTSQTGGSFTYFNDNRGATGSSQRIGQTDYLTLQLPSGTAGGTNRRIGQFDYLNVTTSQGNRLSGDKPEHR